MTDPLDQIDTSTVASLAGSSILVTGGAGFIGSRLAGALADYCDVTVLDDLTGGDPANVPDGAAFIHGDVRDVETVHGAVADADVVFHQAGLTDVATSIRAPLESHGRNANGTMAVLEAARRADARVVFASSAAVYGQPDSLPVQESDRKTPTSPYGIAKLSSDQYARAYADLYDLPTVVLRYFNVYGSGRPPDAGDVVTTFLGRARRGEQLTVHGDGTQTRDFVHVDDVVRANVLAARTDAVGRAFNVGTGEGVSIREVGERIIRLSDSDSDLVHGDARAGDIEHSRADVGRAADELGYEPRVDIERGLRSIASAPPTADQHSGAD